MRKLFHRVIAIMLAGIIALPADSLPLAELDQSILTSLGWAPTIPLSTLKINECPTLAGKYTTSGDEYYVMDDGLAGKKRGNTITSPVVLFSHSQVTANRAGSRIIESSEESERTDKGIFLIKQNESDGILVFRMIAPRDSSKVLQVTLQERLGDFSCKSGKLLFASKSFDNNSEGVRSDYEAQSLVTSLSDGSLLYYESSRSTARSLFVFTGSRNTQRYIRFQKKGNS